MALTNPQGKLIVTNTTGQLVTFPITGTSLSTTGTASFASQVTRGLVSYWKLEESSLDASAVLDSAYSTLGVGQTPGNHGTSFGTSPIVTPGISGSAHSFSGDDYIRVTNHSSLSIASGFSIEMWLYITSNSNNNRILSHSNASTNGYELLIQTDNLINFFLGNSHGSVTTTATFPFNRWVHLACTQSGSSMKVYFDGVEQTVTGSGASNGDAQNSDLFIGNNAALARPIVGYMDELKLYNVQLTGSEVVQNYRSYFNSIVTSNLVSWWRFDNTYNDTALSDTGTGATANNGTNVGGTYTFTNVPGFFPPGGNNALTATSSSDYIKLGSSSSLRPTTEITIEMRCSHATFASKGGSEEEWIDIGSSSIGNQGINIQSLGGPEIAFQLHNAGGTVTLSAGTNSFPYNERDYWSFTYDGSNMKIYKNSVLIASAAKTGSLTYTFTYAIMSGRVTSNTDGDGVNGWSNGNKVDFMRIYSRALSSAEISQNYTSGL